jgi:hypothetical protein
MKKIAALREQRRSRFDLEVLVQADPVEHGDEIGPHRSREAADVRSAVQDVFADGTFRQGPLGGLAGQEHLVQPRVIPMITTPAGVLTASMGQ